ncbi:MAG TPA: hypothetical protein VE287_02470 [Actinopolymorphaceae bacterium]|nr:hypothetical protein [Actinopolymorphaceae bacterium]
MDGSEGDGSTAPPMAAPTPPHPRRRTTAARIAYLVVAALGCAVLVSFGLGIWAYATKDRVETLDDSTVVETADRACATMTVAVQDGATPADYAPAEARADAIRQEDAAVRQMVGVMRTLGPERLDGDQPATAWLADWETLVRLREQFAADLLAGRPARLVLPTVDGYPLTHRMDNVGLACRVPARLLALP